MHNDRAESNLRRFPYSHDVLEVGQLEAVQQQLQLVEMVHAEEGRISTLASQKYRHIPPYETFL